MGFNQSIKSKHLFHSSPGCFHLHGLQLLITSFHWRLLSFFFFCLSFMGCCTCGRLLCSYKSNYRQTQIKGGEKTVCFSEVLSLHEPNKLFDIDPKHLKECTGAINALLPKRDHLSWCFYGGGEERYLTTHSKIAHINTLSFSSSAKHPIF